MLDGNKIEQLAKYYLKEKGIKSYSFRRFCLDNGFSYTEWTDFKNNKKNNSKAIHELVNVFSDLNLNWLIKNEGGMFNMKNEASNTTSDKQDSNNIIEISPSNKSNTLIADIRASAGFGEIIDNPKKLEQLPAISLPDAPMGLNVAFQVSGDSMHPTIRHLDYVAANKINDIESLRDGFVYIIIDKEDGPLCKKIYRNGADFEIVSDNPSYTPYKRSHHQILGFFRAFCRLSFDFRAYQNDIRNDIKELQRRVNTIEHRLDSK